MAVVEGNPGERSRIDVFPLRENCRLAIAGWRPEQGRRCAAVLSAPAHDKLSGHELPLREARAARPGGCRSPSIGVITGLRAQKGLDTCLANPAPPNDFDHTPRLGLGSLLPWWGDTGDRGAVHAPHPLGPISGPLTAARSASAGEQLGLLLLELLVGKRPLLVQLSELLELLHGFGTERP
jgi:hypothetical protein